MDPQPAFEKIHMISMGLGKTTPYILANRRIRVVLKKCVHVRRDLLGSGKLTVSKNQEVSPEDILGISSLNTGFATVNLSKELGVPAQSASQYLQRPIGKTIFKGELLAYKKGILGKKIITAPTDGLVENYDSKSGELKIKYLSKEQPLTAGVYGIVDDVNQESGEVLIKTLVNEIYGMFGSGKERNGILTILSNKLGVINVSQIDASISKHILVTRGLIYGEALRKAAGFGVYGIVGGGFNLSDYRSISGTLTPHNRLGTDVGLSIVATEGFGPIPMGEDIFGIIEQHEGKFAFINGNVSKLLLPLPSSDSILSLRKISLPILPISKLGSLRPETRLDQIKVGDKARIIWPPHIGMQGIVVGIDKTPTNLESGILTYLLTIKTPQNKIKVAYPNIELIG